MTVNETAQKSPASRVGRPAGATVRDRLWLFGVPPGGTPEYLECGGVRGGSRMTPTEGCLWLGVPNLLFITQARNAPPSMWIEREWKARTTMEQWAISFEPLASVVWAAVGSGGVGGSRQVADILEIARHYPNISGIYLDDFVKDAKRQADGRKVGRPAMTEEELQAMRAGLSGIGRPMEVWATIYSREFDRAHPDFHDCRPPLVEAMQHFDVLVLWTWKSAELRDLERNLALLESVKPETARIALGMYLWDYTGIDETRAGQKGYCMGMSVPLDLMEHQAALGLRWLKEGRVSDLVILGNPMLDVGLESAHWMRDWIKQAGNEELSPEDR